MYLCGKIWKDNKVRKKRKNKSFTSPSHGRIKIKKKRRWPPVFSFYDYKEQPQCTNGATR